MPTDTTDPEPTSNARPVATLDEIKADLARRAEAIDTRLHRARAQRDTLAAEIRTHVADQAEAQRLLHALEPRKAKPKPGKATN